MSPTVRLSGPVRRDLRGRDHDRYSRERRSTRAPYLRYGRSEGTGLTVNDYEPATYGDRFADVYEEWHAELFAPEAVEPPVALLAELARGGRALELGIGTGRIALPLAARGAAVHGIDASGAMVARLRARPGGANIPITIGDFADVAVEGRFSLIYVVFNTFYALLSQEEQVRCFRNAAAHLEEDGAFVIEAFVPDTGRYRQGQSVGASRMALDRVMLDVARLDPVQQRIEVQHVLIRDGEVRLYPVQLRYAWPSELDLMARLAGLRLRDRWGGWDRRPFTTASGTHVSVYDLSHSGGERA